MPLLIQKIKSQLLNIKSDDLMFYSIALTFLVLPTGTAPPLIAVSIALLTWVASGRFLKIKSVVVQSWFWPVIPMVLLPWVGLLYSQNMELGLAYAMKTKYWIVATVIAGILIDDRKIFVILRCFWMGLFIGAVLAFLQYIGVLSPIKDGFLGFGVVHTLISLYLIIGILTVSFYFKKSKTKAGRLVLFFLIIAFCFHISVLKGRAGYLVFVLLSPLIANNLMYKFSLKLKVVFTAILISSILLSPVVRERVKTTYIDLNLQKEKIFNFEHIAVFPRFFIYYEAFNIIKDHPFTGIGTGSITEYTKKKGSLVEHPHNNFLYMGVSFGFWGIIACFWLFWRMLQNSWAYRESALGAFVFYSCIVLFLGGLLDTQILNTGTLLFLSLSYGMLYHLNKKEISRHAG